MFKLQRNFVILKTTIMVNPKHLATFLLGAAAGAAIMKYNSMTDEEIKAQ